MMTTTISTTATSPTPVLFTTATIIIMIRGILIRLWHNPGMPLQIVNHARNVRETQLLTS
jgi:hypothetical protein